MMSVFERGKFARQRPVEGDPRRHAPIDFARYMRKQHVKKGKRH